MSEPSWRKAGRQDVRALEAFLRAREPRAAGFIGKSLRDGRLRLPNPLRGAVWLRFDRSGRISDALLCSPGGLVFPQFSCHSPVSGGDGFLSDAVYGTGFVPASAVGPAAYVERFERALFLKPLVSIAYRLMLRRGGAPRGSDRLPGLSIRRASRADLASVYPLQEAYEREEVATSIHEFNPSGCRAALARNLEERIIFVAELDGHLVGKAGTNARAFALDQVGGVFVAPPYRGKGIGSALMLSLLDLLAAEGRDASLFVKRENTAARALYDSLGFEDLEDFRADYFMP